MSAPALPSARSPMAMAGALHDQATRLGFVMGCAALAVIVVAYNAEVALRYLFNSPTTWSADIVSYMLCAATFLVFPDVTRRSAHVAITSLIESLPPTATVRVGQAIGISGAILCATTAVIVVSQAQIQHEQGIETVAAYAIPKWWLSAIVAYGFASSALHLARQAFRRDAGAPGAELPA